MTYSTRKDAKLMVYITASSAAKLTSLVEDMDTPYNNNTKVWQMENGKQSINPVCTKQEKDSSEELKLQRIFPLYDYTPRKTQYTEDYIFQNKSDSQVYSKKRRNFFNCFQKIELEKIFVTNPYPSKEMCEILARKFGSNPYSMKIWFKNRRARQKKMSQSGEPNEPKTSTRIYSLPYGGGQMSEYLLCPSTVRAAPHHYPISVINKVHFGPQFSGIDNMRCSAFSAYQKQTQYHDKK